MLTRQQREDDHLLWHVMPLKKTPGSARVSSKWYYRASPAGSDSSVLDVLESHNIVQQSIQHKIAVASYDAYL
jgi:hypothetical protein